MYSLLSAFLDAAFVVRVNFAATALVREQCMRQHAASKMPKLFFTAAEDETLIENIQNNAVIYDSAHPKHKDVIFKDVLWKEISENVCRSVDDCKKRWRNIRDSYMKNKKKLGTGSASVTKNAWSLSTRVSFLDKFEHERRTISNVSPSTPVVNENPVDDIDPDDYNGEEQLPAEESIHTPSPSEMRGKKRKSNADKLGTILSKRSKERDAIFKQIQSQNELLLSLEQNQDDDVDLFFKSIAKTVKSLPKKGIAEAKLVVLTAITELENKYSEQESSSTHTHSIPFTETSTSIPGHQQKLFTPYDIPNNSLVSNEPIQYNHDENYIFPN